jgi:sugar/nucleoside kinase (ribokinase family)
MSSSLNHDEVGQIASRLRTGNATPNPPTNIDALTDACAALSKATNAPRICVTMAAAGAALWDRGNLVLAPAPKVIVKDTVGAGDAFMAGFDARVDTGSRHSNGCATACRLGAIVASHDGATPLLPQEIIQEFRSNLTADKPSQVSPGA